MNPLRDGFTCSVIKTGGFHHTLPCLKGAKNSILSAS